MSLTRRYFLKSAAALSAAAAARPQLMAKAPPVRSANQKFGAAVVGTGGRGGSHINSLLGLSNVELRTVCDVDLTRAQAASKTIADGGHPAPEAARQPAKPTGPH